MLNNIYRCKNCGVYAIAEEKDNHVCMEIKDTRIEGDLRLISDGSKWYPLKIKKRSEPDPTDLHMDKNRQRGTRTFYKHDFYNELNQMLTTW